MTSIVAVNRLLGFVTSPNTGFKSSKADFLWEELLSISIRQPLAGHSLLPPWHTIGRILSLCASASDSQHRQGRNAGSISLPTRSL
jgi:hypothetical protein